MRESIFNPLFRFMRRLGASHPDCQPSPANTGEKTELNRHLTFGNGESIVMTVRTTGEQITIIHDNGDFANFPGIAAEDMDEINRYLKNGSLSPNVKFRTFFSSSDGGGWKVTWCVQPDGRYWEDEDGYGGESDKEINLCSHLSDEGCFTQPFKLYSVGTLL